MDEEGFPGNKEEHTPSQEIAGMLRSFGEEVGFDEETCVEIATQPFEEAFETAYSYLTQAGLDANELLSPYIEAPENNPA